MLAIAKRNLLLYFKNKSNIFFSLLGSLIVFGLFVIFIRQNLIDGFKGLENRKQIADMWMLGALIPVTAITTSFSMISQMISDKLADKFLDFSLTDRSDQQIVLGYYFSATLLALCMQIFVFALCMIYFHFEEGKSLTIKQISVMLLFILVTAFLAAAINLLIGGFLNSQIALSSVSGIISAMAGFVMGGYVPIGEVSKVVRQTIQFFPLTYSAAGMREVLFADLLDKLPASSQKYLLKYFGIKVDLGSQLTNVQLDFLILLGSLAVLCLILLLLSKRLMRASLSGKKGE